MILISTNSKEIRRFGLIAFIFFGGLCGFGLWRNRIPAASFFGVLSFLGFCILVLPKHFKPVYKGWVRIGHYIGYIFTIIAMSLIYFIVVTPIAIIKRNIGEKPISLELEFGKKSYWIDRVEPIQPLERIHKRY